MRDIKSEIYGLLFNTQGQYNSIEPADHTIPTEKYWPDEIEYPNAYRYFIFSDLGNGLRDGVIAENIKLKEVAVKKLKEIHGIKDPWDDDPQYFNKKL